MRYHLGAEELIELGRDGALVLRERRPFLAGRSRSPELGILDMLGDVAGFFADALAFTFNTLGDLIGVPLGILAQGVDVTFNGVAGLLKNIPILGDLLAQVLVLGGSLIKFGLSIPGLALHGLGNVMAGIGKALKGENSTAQNDAKVDQAKKDVVNKAPDPLKDNVKKIIEAAGVTGSNLTPSVSSSGQPIPAAAGTGVPVSEEKSDLEKALTIGVPVAGGLALLLVLLK